MACGLKNLSVVIDPLNESNTFTTGDLISRRVILQLKKETGIESLFVKAKGKAKASSFFYQDKETCFKSIQYFIQEQKTKGQDGYSLLTNECEQGYSRTVGPGIHIYPFTIQIPHQDMPASFKGYHGKVVYFLEAKLCRSMPVPKKAKVFFNYVPKEDMSTPDLMISQHVHKEQKIKFLSSGSVAMDVHTEKMGFHLGEQIMVTIDIENNSTRTVKPKFSLYQKQSFFASKKRKVKTKELIKRKGDPIEPLTKQSLTEVLNIPTDTSISILNCRILKVEYRLKVHLDIKFAHDLEIKLPVVILPDCVTQNEKDVANTDLGTGIELTSKKEDSSN
ncbi:Arrestin domain-containing protein 3 [Bagarius yarrelli]|uniref:Arrestin domain-containing protein 3 n=1 Tax=Bagarius yarrelli TaxID=175774 RepID=A0A556U597_BAGYA|nr:Arrestin domain-containing protein 3 [Bagarius yarrelli]